jgi:ribosomal protein S11
MAAPTVNALRSRITSIFNAAAPAAAAAEAAAAAQAAARTADSFITVTSTMNNLHVCVSDIEGQVISKMSGGHLGYKHRARASPEVAQQLGAAIAKRAVQHGFTVAHLRFKGPSGGRTGVIRGLKTNGITILDMKDITMMPTNGCRPKHMRRL